MLELFVFLIPSVAKMSKPLTSFAKLQMLLRNKRVQVWNEVLAPKWCVLRGGSPPPLICSTGQFGGIIQGIFSKLTSYALIAPPVKGGAERWQGGVGAPLV